MFSLFFHEKLEKVQKDQQLQQKKHLKSLSAQIQFREQLIENNRKRVEKRVQDMASEPIPINRHEFSLKLPEFKGESFIRARPRDSKERVKAAEQDASWLDPIPLLPSPHDFRPRHKSKELNHFMKYTPRDRYERVVDTWNKQSNALEHSWQLGEAPSSSPKVFPNTLKKSYYKTLETEALGIQVKRNQQDLEDGISKSDRRLFEIAQEAMDKCKLRPLKEELQSIHSVKSSKIQAEVIRK
jgi:hypothetical protein